MQISLINTIINKDSYLDEIGPDAKLIDLDNDGIPEALLEYLAGSNHEFPTSIYKLRNGNLEYIDEGNCSSSIPAYSDGQQYSFIIEGASIEGASQTWEYIDRYSLAENGLTHFESFEHFLHERSENPNIEHWKYNGDELSESEYNNAYSKMLMI